VIVADDHDARGCTNGLDVCGGLNPMLLEPVAYMMAGRVVANAVGHKQAGLTEGGEHRGHHGAVCRDAVFNRLDLGTAVRCWELRHLPQTGGGQVARHATRPP
jgi:hypothetical protein